MGSILPQYSLVRDQRMHMATSSIPITIKERLSFERSVIANARKPSTWEAGAESSAIQGHPWLHNELGAILGYMRVCKNSLLPFSL